MPPGIPYIIGNEAAERFSYYGMKTILIIFMTDYLMMSENKGTIWVHSFSTAAYFLPLFGGLLSDIFLGKYRTIISLSIFYCLGHLVLALFETQNGLAVGLMLIAMGSGGIKSCVSAHVGDQFNKNNSHLIERVFGYFYLSINVGAMLSTLATPWLLQNHGPSVAFGVPGLLMLIATFLFWSGRNKFIAIPPAGWKAYKQQVFNKTGLNAILKLSVIYVFIAIFWSLYDQTMSTWVLQAKRELMDKHFDLGFWQFDILPEQVQAVNPLLILTLTPLFSFLVYPLVGKFVRVTPLRKISFGLFITGISFLVIGWLDGRMAQGISMHVSWQFLAFFIITSAEVMVSITALEFSYTQAPNVMKSLIMGLFWMSVALGNVITTAVNSFIVTEVRLVELETGNRTYFTVNDEEYIEEGIKLEFSEMLGIRTIRKSDTLALAGTFLIGEVDHSNNTFEILDIDRHPVQTVQTATFQPSIIYVNKLKGFTYFYFFTGLMTTAAVLFVGIARRYREEQFIQEHVVSDIH